MVRCVERDGTFTPIAYCVHLPLTWANFRLAELLAAAEAAGVDVLLEDEEARATLMARKDGVLLRVGLRDETSARRLASRAVLAKQFVEEWACGESWDEMAAALQAYPPELAAPFLAEGSTFAVNVKSFGRKISDQDRLELIRKLQPLLHWRGRASMKNPDHAFFVFVDDPTLHHRSDDRREGEGKRKEGGKRASTAAGGAGGALVRPRYVFGRWVADGRRDLVSRYDLKKRNYIGTTSLDAELSLLMANMARIRSADFVYDPYCGTAGTLVAAAAFGARVVGCDLNLPALRGELRTRSGPSKLNQPEVQGIPETFGQYNLPLPIDRLHGDSGAHLAFLRPSSRGIFDAILTDPPYGIREKPSEVADERLLARTLPAEHVESHVPRTALASIERILSDLFALAAATLVDGGRLVFLLPTTVPFTESVLPAHPSLVLEEASEQQMAARWSRWCVTLRRVSRGIEGQGGEVIHTNNPHLSAVALLTRPWMAPSAATAVAAAAKPSPTPSHAAPPSSIFSRPTLLPDTPRAPIFDRSSLRPDDAANAEPAHAAASAAAATVLHPHLLGKSAGARKRLERRLAQTNPHPHPLKGSSDRATKRQVREPHRTHART